MKFIYQVPEVQIISFRADDIITTSEFLDGLNNAGEGSGDSGSFKDWFPGL